MKYRTVAYSLASPQSLLRYSNHHAMRDANIIHTHYVLIQAYFNEHNISYDEIRQLTNLSWTSLLKLVSCDLNVWIYEAYFINRFPHIINWGLNILLSSWFCRVYPYIGYFMFKGLNDLIVLWLFLFFSDELLEMVQFVLNNTIQIIFKILANTSQQRLNVQGIVRLIQQDKRLLNMDDHVRTQFWQLGWKQPV